jgi:hypothetical protein
MLIIRFVWTSFGLWRLERELKALLADNWQIVDYGLDTAFLGLRWVVTVHLELNPQPLPPGAKATRK